MSSDVERCFEETDASTQKDLSKTVESAHKSYDWKTTLAESRYGQELQDWDVAIALAEKHNDEAR